MEPPWGEEWGLTLRTCVQQRRLCLLSPCGEWFSCSSAGSLPKHHRHVLFVCWRGSPFFYCRLKGLLFGKIWTLEGKDLDLWVSGSVAWKSERREKLSGFPAVIGISLLLGKWRRGMLYSQKSVSSPHMLSWMLAV